MKKSTKVTIALFVALMLIFNIFMPMFNVYAETRVVVSLNGIVQGNSTEGYTVTYNVDGANVILTVAAGINVDMENNKQIDVALNENRTIPGLALGDTFNSETMQVKVEASDGFNTILEVENGNLKLAEGVGIPTGAALTIEKIPTNPEQQGDGDDNQNNQQGGNPSTFDGNAYFVWMSGDKICYHKVTGLTGQKPDHSGYDMNYVNVDDLTDQSGNNGSYTWGQEDANWVLASDMEENGVVKANLTKEYIFGVPEEDMGVQLDPCGAEDGINSICSNGNMNFRVTIYRDGYQAIKFGTNASDYTYFPGFWDQTFFTSTVDLSGTTKTNPAVYQTYLLEPSISFEVGDNSKSNSITSVVALDVNPNAVTITKNNGKYTIKFNSSYYDHVVFEITTANGQKNYIKIARITLRVRDNWGPNTTNPKLIAELYDPTSNSYKDFEVVATVVKKDGSTTTSTLEVDSSSNVNGGQGLYMCEYSVDASRDTTLGAYFTVIQKGALNGKTYGGTFSGSGKGVYFNCESRRMEFGK